MNTNELTLWKKLLAFEFDEPGTQFTFEKRLARENGWSLGYTKRVIMEYKRFIFLCTVTKSGVTPSDPVDQAWHLHLTYTNSYWNLMCKDVLNKEIHHNPTKGGKKEGEKFNIFYDKTRDMYKQFFGVDQPGDIWHNNKKRFSDINFQRINLSKFWLIKKPNFWISNKSIAILILMLSLSFVGMSGAGWLVIAILVLLVILIIIGAINSNKKNKRNGGDSSGSSGCGSDAGSGGWFIFGGGGCSSDSGGDSGGHSGCGSSGCSGCGGGGCGGGCSS
jgi:hypothetical protein